jgi:histidine triad (HIT) family protein
MTDCLFCRMERGELPVEKVYEDGDVFVIRDIQPRAPVHLLVIPRRHIPHAQHLGPDDGPVLAALFGAATVAARAAGIGESGYRLAFNVLGDSGMTVHHLHLHVVGGRPLGPEG